MKNLEFMMKLIIPVIPRQNILNIYLCNFVILAAEVNIMVNLCIDYSFV